MIGHPHCRKSLEKKTLEYILGKKWYNYEYDEIYCEHDTHTPKEVRLEKATHAMRYQLASRARWMLVGGLELRVLYMRG